MSVAAAEIGTDMLRIEPDGLAERSQGAIRMPLIGENMAAFGEGAGEQRIKTDGGIEIGQSLLRPPQAVM